MNAVNRKADGEAKAAVMRRVTDGNNRNRASQPSLAGLAHNTGLAAFTNPTQPMTTKKGREDYYEDSTEIKFFTDLGFVVEDTGGGCQWLRLQLNENVSLVVTDGEAGLPDLTAQLYLMCGEHSECLAQGKLMTSYQLADKLAQSGIGL